MIQRVQSLFLFFSAIVSLVILFYAPVYITTEGDVIIMNELQYSSLFLMLSILLTIFSVFQFKNRLRQIKIVSFARTAITVSFFLFIFTRDESLEVLYYGGSLLIIPYIILFLSAYFIKKDEKLVKSADRIR